MKRTVLVAAIAGMLVAAFATVAYADPHNGGPHKSDPSCSINPNPAAVGATYVVSATGLPSLSPINLFVTDPLGTVVGSPLGGTADGTFALDESSALAGTTTYEFTGPVKVNNTQVYATCSVDAY